MKLLGDYMSQPFRSCLILCRVTGLNVEIVDVQIGKGATKSTEFRKLNPLGKVPVLQDGDFVLVESASIMRYLCETQDVPDHWFPKDPHRRAKVNSAMDWHLNNLRMGSAITLFNRALGKNLGVRTNDRLVEDFGLPTLKTSLQNLNNVWLSEGMYVAGGSQPSIADLLMSCEIEMLRLMDASEQGPTFEEILGPVPAVRAWMERVASACEPHYSEVHAVMMKVRARLMAGMRQENMRDSRL